MNVAPAPVEAALARLGELLLTGGPSPDDLLAVLRELRRQGLSAADLEVHVERARARNDTATGSPGIEDNCLMAIDMLTGWCAPAYAVDIVPAEGSTGDQPTK